MRALAAAAAVVVLAACAPTQSQLTGDRGAPIDTKVVAAATDAGFADCVPNEEAPDFTTICMTTGEPASVQFPDGRPSVVNFWASWCEPCREELPLLARAAREFEGQVTFIGMDFADPAPLEAIALAKRSGVTYAQYADPASSLKVQYALRGLPQTVFVDATGQIVGTQHAPYESYDQIVADLENFLEVTP